jgi:hypothetical protein
MFESNKVGWSKYISRDIGNSLPNYDTSWISSKRWGDGSSKLLNQANFVPNNDHLQLMIKCKKG